MLLLTDLWTNSAVMVYLAFAAVPKLYPPYLIMSFCEEITVYYVRLELKHVNVYLRDTFIFLRPPQTQWKRRAYLQIVLRRKLGTKPLFEDNKLYVGINGQLRADCWGTFISCSRSRRSCFLPHSTPSFIPERLLLVLVYNGIRLFSQRFVFSWDVSNY